MLQKKGYPEEDSLVLASVTKVNPNSVFVVLDHYNKRTALIHISEISPGRIRNIRDYVVEGKKIVVKVLKVDKDKGHIDVSLRRVTEMQKREFMDSIKQEQKAEKLMENFAQQNKIPKPELNKIIQNIGKQYEFVWDFFQDIIDENINASEFAGKNASKLEEYVKEKIQPERVHIKGKMKVTLFDSDGIEQIKKLLSEQIDDNTSISYLGAGLYSVVITAEDFKQAEKILKQKINKIESYVEDKKGIFSFEKKE